MQLPWLADIQTAGSSYTLPYYFAPSFATTVWTHTVCSFPRQLPKLKHSSRALKLTWHSSSGCSLLEGFHRQGKGTSR
jgi:hypothetical protein